MNNDFDTMVNMISLILGIENLRENLSQNDKYEIMRRVDETTEILLRKVDERIEEQNKMLKEILNRLDRSGNSDIIEKE